MKAPKPKAPVNAPPGTVEIGGPIEWFDITLAVKGEDLDPNEISATMGRMPNQSQRKDKALYRPDGSLMRVPKFGAWWATLKREDTDEWDCGEAIAELLATMPRDPAIWGDLGRRYRVSVSVGLSLVADPKGFELSPDVMAYLGERRITVGFDIYHEEEENG